MDTKHCIKCGSNKPLTDFSPRASSKDGRRGSCRVCDNERKVAWAKANPQKIKAIRRRYIEKDTAAFKAAALARAAAYRSRHAERVRQRNFAAYWANPKPKRAAALRSREKNLAAARQRDRDWAKSNPALNRAKAARCRRQRPPCLTKEDLRSIAFAYQCCVMWSSATGVLHHVDHVIPLRGKLVSGLHVPWNLRILPAKENLKKGNRLDSESAMS